MAPIRIPPWLIDKMRSPVATGAALALGLRVGQELYRVASQEISLEEFKRRAGIHVGMLTGTVTGAVAGSLVGRWVPGVGTLLGAFAGGLSGQFLGTHLTYKGADKIAPHLPVEVDPTKEEPAHEADGDREEPPSSSEET